MKMIDPEGSCHDVSRHGTINDFTPSDKRSENTTGIISSDCVARVRTSTKAARCTDVALNPNHDILNVRLVKDLNHFPKDETRS